MTSENHNHKNAEENPVVFFDVRFGAAKAGRIVIELFKNVVPKTAENFRALCTGERGVSPGGTLLHYKNTSFHRVVPMCMVQGGDIVKKDGTGGESIYGKKFDDENFTIPHDGAGIVGMSSNGPNTNNSQFYITTVPCSHLDGLNVAFGKVRKGLNIVIEMSEIPRDCDVPTEVRSSIPQTDQDLEFHLPIVIENSGELKPGENWCVEENDETEDMYPPWPDDWEVNTEEDKLIENAINKIKDSGNYFFNKKNYIDSERKYVKALRYIDWSISLNSSRNGRMEGVRLHSLLNLAAVRLKRNKHSKVVDLCNQVIRTDPNNAKAFYRRAQARLALKDYDKALKDLTTASSLQPNDKNIQAVLKVARKKKLIYLQREKQFYGNCFK